jgi:isoquinoline 1-oxidoreductase beta subunit
MHFDSDLQDLASLLPKGMLARAERAQGATKSGVDEGLARRSFLKLSVASGFALGVFPQSALAQEGKQAGPQRSNPSSNPARLCALPQMAR